MCIKLKHKQQVIQLIQITDTHLAAETGGQLLGMDTDVSLSHVVKLVAAQRSNIDLLLATGDLSNCGEVSSYRRFRDLTKSLARHTLWLPGNHDSREAMQESIDGGEELSRIMLIGNWQIIMLDSTISGAVGGKLSERELEFLYQSLKASALKKHNNCVEHVLICLHHHPIEIECKWLDEQKVANAEQFFNILDEFNHVRGVLWGHIHQRIDTHRHSVKLMATPSSCIQFAPKSQHFKLDRLNPGYRWLSLHKNGCIETDVCRVTDISFDLDYENSKGY